MERVFGQERGRCWKGSESNYFRINQIQISLIPYHFHQDIPQDCIYQRDVTQR